MLNFDVEIISFSLEKKGIYLGSISSLAKEKNKE
jgi:hypothetical protein